MVIAPEDASRFIKHYQDFLISIADPKESQGRSHLQILATARNRYAANRDLFSSWRAKNLQRDSDILDAIACLEIGRWIYLKDTRSYSVFLREDCEAAYAVHGLTDRLRNITGYSGIVVTCGVFQLNDQYVCDGLLANDATLGSNYLADFRETYQSLRKSGNFYAKPSEALGKATD